MDASVDVDASVDMDANVDMAVDADVACLFTLWNVMFAACGLRIDVRC